MINNKALEKLFMRSVLLKVEEGHSLEFVSHTYHLELEAQGFIFMIGDRWRLTHLGVREIIPPEVTTTPIPKTLFKTHHGKNKNIQH